MDPGLRQRLSESLEALAGVFRTPDLRRLGLAYMTSLVALWAYGVAISVYAFEIGGPALAGLAAVLRLIPAAITAPFGALLADRYPRRRVLVATDLVRAALIAFACVAIALGAPPIFVFGLAAANNIVGTLFEPAKNALMPELASEPEQLTAANTAMSTFESTSIFLGPAIAGLVLSVSNTQVVLGMTGALLLFSAAQIARVSPDTGVKSAADAVGNSWSEAIAGFRELRQNPSLRTIVGLFAAQMLVDGLLIVMTLSLAIDLLGIGQAGVGYLNSVVGIGGLIGAVATLALTGRRGLAVLFGFGLAAWGIPILLIGFFPSTVVALLLMAVLGVANTVVDSTAVTLMQRLVPEQMAGRVFGVLEGLIIASVAAGSILAPILISGFGVRGALILTGAFLPLLAFLARPALLRADAAAAPPSRRLALLRGVPMFASLGPVPLEELAADLEPRRCTAGEKIIRQGDAGDLFYILDSGEVEVFEDGRRARREGPGGYFGEIALLRDVPRTATVVATTEVELVTLGRDRFLEAVTRDRGSLQAAEAVVVARLGSVHRLRDRARRAPREEAVAAL